MRITQNQKKYDRPKITLKALKPYGQTIELELRKKCTLQKPGTVNDQLVKCLRRDQYII